jgi:hypothetical protein
VQDGGTPQLVIGQFVCIEGTGSSEGNVWVEQQVTNAVIANLDAGKIDTGLLLADRIGADTITTFHLAADSVTTEQLAAGAIDGILITGAVIRTAATGERLELNSLDGLVGYDSAENERISLDGSSLILKKGTKSGEITTDTNGVVITSSGQALFSSDDTMFLQSAAGIELNSSLSSSVKINGMFWIGGDGLIRSPATAGSETTVAANVFINQTAYNMARSTSLRAAKLAIQPIPESEIEGLLDLEVSTWFDRCASELYAEAMAASDEAERERILADMMTDLRRIPGLIAEDVEAHASRFATYDNEGRLSGVAYDRIGVAWIPFVRSLIDRVTALEGEQNDPAGP